MSSTRRWIVCAGIALSLPVLIASWWMLDREPFPSPGYPDGGPDSFTASETASGARSGTSTVRAATAPDRSGPQEAVGNVDIASFRANAEEMRMQGFPEDTVREVIASRITATFESRRSTLRREMGKGRNDEADIHAKLDALNREQGTIIASVVGAEAPAVTVSSASSPDAERTAEGQVLMPAVMAEAVPSTVKTDEQASEWARLRESFVNAVSALSADPASPEYRRRWVQAEGEADQRFRLMFGDTAFVQHQLQAQREARVREQGVGGK